MIDIIGVFWTTMTQRKSARMNRKSKAHNETERNRQKNCRKDQKRNEWIGMNEYLIDVSAFDAQNTAIAYLTSRDRNL